MPQAELAGEPLPISVTPSLHGLTMGLPSDHEVVFEGALEVRISEIWTQTLPVEAHSGPMLLTCGSRATIGRKHVLRPQLLHLSL